MHCLSCNSRALSPAVRVRMFHSLPRCSFVAPVFVCQLSDAEIEKEFGRQRAGLEKSLEVLKKKASKDATVFSSDRSRLLRENAVLTSDINALR